MKLYGTTFCGNEASDYAKQNGYLDYATLAKAFDAVLNNDIMEVTETNGLGFWEPISGYDDDTWVPEVFQWFIVSKSGADILREINEVVFYNDALDLYLWGVTHWGTSWEYVLTDIKLNAGDESDE